jgi:transcriptional regulator with XRE-family HTH domain
LIVMEMLQAREALRELRFRQRKAINTLADESGIDRTTIYRIENTKRLPDYQPELQTLHRLAVALGTTLAQLAPTVGAPTAPPPAPAVVPAAQVADALIGRRVRALGPELAEALLETLAAYERLAASRRRRSPDASDQPARPEGERRASRGGRRLGE